MDLNAYVPRKNPLTLLEAFNLIKDECTLDLVFGGGYSARSTIRALEQFINDNNLSKRVHLLHSVSDEEKNWLIDNASIFVSPTLSEGFGRTPIEAAIRCKPVLTTKVDSVFEVTMGLLNYVENPLDAKEYANEILRLLDNPIDSQVLQEIAQRYKETYSVKGVADKYLMLFRNV